jgi:hypothetical protein
MGGQIFALAAAARQKHGHAKRDQADPGKDKKKTRRTEAAGLTSAPAIELTAQKAVSACLAA